LPRCRAEPPTSRIVASRFGEKGGLEGWSGEEVSDISLACRQIGPIRFKLKLAQGEDVFHARRSLVFKKIADCAGMRHQVYVLNTWYTRIVS
jgi:hypothetical protein